MKKYTFIRFIEISITKGKKEKSIYENGLDLINFLDEYTKMNNILLNSIYGESTADIIGDFIIDSIYDELEKNKSNYHELTTHGLFFALTISSINNKHNQTGSVQPERAESSCSVRTPERFEPSGICHVG